MKTTTPKRMFNKFQRKKVRPFTERTGDWICKECHNLNFAFRNECNRCHMPKKVVEDKKVEENQNEGNQKNNENDVKNKEKEKEENPKGNEVNINFMTNDKKIFGKEISNGTINSCGKESCCNYQTYIPKNRYKYKKYYNHNNYYEKNINNKSSNHIEENYLIKKN